MSTAIGSTQQLLAQTVNRLRREAVLQIDTQMRTLLTAGTVDILQTSLAATTARKPSPGSILQILNIQA